MTASAAPAIAEAPAPARWPYYPIEAMRWRHVTVEVTTAGGAEVRARVERRADDRGHDWWFELRGEAKVPLVRYRTSAGRWAPVLWRPIPGVLWPYELPAPAERTAVQGAALGAPVDGRGRRWERPADEPLDPHRASDGWPYPGLVLGGRGVKPASAPEAEARLLRALRTSRMRDVVKDDIVRRTRSADIPAELARIWERHREYEALVEALREGRMPTDAAAVRSAWTPTRRDLGEWWDVIQWLRPLSGMQRDMFDKRSQDPPPSWAEIGRAVGVERRRVAEVYAEAVDALFHVARG